MFARFLLILFNFAYQSFLDLKNQFRITNICFLELLFFTFISIIKILIVGQGVISYHFLDPNIGIFITASIANQYSRIPQQKPSSNQYPFLSN